MRSTLITDTRDLSRPGRRDVEVCDDRHVRVGLLFLYMALAVCMSGHSTPTRSHLTIYTYIVHRSDDLEGGFPLASRTLSCT